MKNLSYGPDSCSVWEAEDPFSVYQGDEKNDTEKASNYLVDGGITGTEVELDTSGSRAREI